MLNCIATKPDARKILFQLWKGSEVGMTKHEAVEILEEIKTLDDSIFAYSQAYNDALEMAIEALKAQEPKVMTIGDLYGQDMGYYERKDEELVWPVLIARGGPDEDGMVGIVRKDAFEIKADCGLMNITWRIWTEYPTIVQREATPWEP